MVDLVLVGTVVAFLVGTGLLTTIVVKILSWWGDYKEFKGSTNARITKLETSLDSRLLSMVQQVRENDPIKERLSRVEETLRAHRRER